MKSSENAFIRMMDVCKEANENNGIAVVINMTHVHHKYKAAALEKTMCEVKDPGFMLYLENSWIKSDEQRDEIMKAARYVFMISCDGDGVPILKQVLPEPKYSSKQWIL